MAGTFFWSNIFAPISYLILTLLSLIRYLFIRVITSNCISLFSVEEMSKITNRTGAFCVDLVSYDVSHWQGLWLFDVQSAGTEKPDIGVIVPNHRNQKITKIDRHINWDMP